MNFEFLKTAAASPKLLPADVPHNQEEIVKMVWEAHHHHADVLVFPELALSGSTCGDLFHHTTLLTACYNALQSILRQTANSQVFCVLGLPLAVHGRIYSVCAAFQRGRLLAVVPKYPLTPSELRFFAEPCPEPSTVSLFGQDVPFGSFSFADPNFPGVSLSIVFPAPARCASLLALCPGSGPELVGQARYRRMVLSALSAQSCCGVVYAGASPLESSADAVCSGHCLIAEHGSLLAESPLFSTGILYADIDTDLLLADRRTQYHADSLTCIPVTFQPCDTPLDRVIPQNPFLPACGLAERCEEILAIQSHALKKRLSHLLPHGGGHAVLGVSGGLDSTLALCVTAKAFQLLGLDPAQITAVSMPCFGTTPRTKTNAQRLAEQFGVTFREIPVTQSVEQHFADIGHDPDVHDVTYENAQARERTQVLMDLANAQNGIVVGTGDLSELALGWATFNGDHMSMYGINAGVPKTLVRVLVQHLAETAPEELSAVLYDILDTPVSPELLPPENGEIAQKTEELVGPYQLHDFFLFYTLRYGFSPQKILFLAKTAFAGVYPEDTISHWLHVFFRRFLSQQFKRSCLPDGPQIGTVGLSPRGAWKMPSDVGITLWSDF